MSEEANNNISQVENRFLVFTLKEEKYAISLLRVKEVIAPTSITPMPNTPHYFRGIMNLRGQVISIMDLRLKFKMKDFEDGPETTIVILDIPNLSIGVVVDSVDCVLFSSQESIQAPPAVDGKIDTEYIDGVIEQDGGLILLIDIEKTLSTNDIQHTLNNKNIA